MRPEVVSQMRIVLSLELEARRGRLGVWRWKGSHAKEVIHFVCPLNGPPRGSPEGENSRTVLSILPVAIAVASGDQDTTKTQEVWPLRVCKGVPVSQSHIRAVESPLPVTRCEDEAGEKEVARMASPWPGMAEEQREMARTRKTA